MPFYEPNSADPWPLQCLDRLRGLLAAHASVQGLFQGDLGQFPATDAPEFDADTATRLPPLVTLHSSRFTGIAHQTMGQAGSEGGLQGNILPVILTANLHTNQKGSDRAAMDSAYRSLWITASAFQVAVSAYSADPGPLSNAIPRRLWHSLQFSASPPTIEITRDVDHLLRAVLRFTLTGQAPRPERPTAVPLIP